MSTLYSSTLLKTISPYIKSLSRNELAYALSRVRDCSMSSPSEFFGFDPEAPTIARAFSWACAPQGVNFWSRLHAEFEENSEVYYESH